jgi:hypothetical protein
LKWRNRHNGAISKHMRYLFLLILLFSAGVSFAQNTALSKIPASGSTLQTFIPAGYDTIETVSGDLNKDNVDDYAMVLKSTREENYDPSVDTTELPARLLVVVFGQKTGYKLAGKSDKAIMCKECGGIFGDPFAGISITKGILIIDHYGGSAWKWAYTHKFRYQQNDIYLIGETDHSFWSVNHCEALDDFAGTNYKDVNLVTGAYEEKVISEECKLVKNKKGKQKVVPLTKLKDFSLE